MKINIEVGSFNMKINGQKIPLDKEAYNFIRRFDRELPVKPTEIQISS